MSKKNQHLERFGKYLILDHLVDGGMAKICRAKFLGEHSKIVIIKMVQSKYSKDHNFVSMFENEVKVTFGLLHPNIVQTYDYGMHQGQLYVAMEYCDGKNLKEYNDKLKKQKNVFPIPIIIYIITEVCKGLHYAHGLTDKLSGKKMGIIHRDVSPHNIMLTYDGAIKLIDFGIAKASVNPDATQAGTIKGKLSYLAPEYLEGKELDPRYDQFTVGITMWEMLCGRKLFKASNDLAVLKLIQECKVPTPSSINPNISEELDQILLKALSKDRKKRYANMIDFNKALIKFLYANYPDFNSSDISYFASSLFKDEIKRDREKLYKYGTIDINNYIKEYKNEMEGDGDRRTHEKDEDEDDYHKEPRTKKQTSGKKEERILDFGYEEEDSKSFRSTKEKRSLALNDKSSVTESKIDLDKKFGKLSEKNNLNIEDKSQPTKNNLSATDTTAHFTRPEKAKIHKGKSSIHNIKEKSSTSHHEKKAELSANKRLLLLASIAIILSILYSDDIKKFFFKDDNKRRDNTAEVIPNPATDHRTKPKTGKAKIRFSNLQKYKDKVYVNRKIASIGIINDIDIPANKEVTIRIQRPGRKYFVKKFKLKDSEEVSIEIPPLPFVNFDYLNTSRRCVIGELSFTIFGEKRTEKLPITGGLGIAFPAGDFISGVPQPKNHTVYYRFHQENIKRSVSFQVKGNNENIDLCELIQRAKVRELPHGR